MARKVRIGVSVFFGVLAVALCVLWVRSYWGLMGSEVLVAPGYRYRVASADGTLFLLRQERVFISYELMFDDPYSHSIFELTKRMRLGIGKFSDGVSVRYCLLVPLAMVAAMLPWAQRRYSLRALLVAMTVVAVVLGLAVGVRPVKRPNHRTANYKRVGSWPMCAGGFVPNGNR